MYISCNMLLRAVLFCQPVALCKARFMLLECETPLNSRLLSPGLMVSRPWSPDSRRRFAKHFQNKPDGFFPACLLLIFRPNRKKKKKKIIFVFIPIVIQLCISEKFQRSKHIYIFGLRITLNNWVIIQLITEGKQQHCPCLFRCQLFGSCFLNLDMRSVLWWVVLHVFVLLLLFYFIIFLEGGV